MNDRINVHAYVRGCTEREREREREITNHGLHRWSPFEASRMPRLLEQFHLTKPFFFVTVCIFVQSTTARVHTPAMDRTSESFYRTDEMLRVVIQRVNEASLLMVIYLSLFCDVCMCITCVSHFCFIFVRIVCLISRIISLGMKALDKGW